jgi:hypothetical protein
MSYLIQKFEDGQTLTASHLNMIEQGIIKAEVDRIYPITSSGYYSETCAATSNSSYEKCTFDVRKYRGSTIVVNAAPNKTGYCTLVGNSNSDIIEQWNTGTCKYLQVPETAVKLYVSNSSSTLSNFYIEVPKSKERNKGFLFYENFHKEVNLDYNDFVGHKINGEFKDGGLVLNTGIANAIILNKVFLADAQTHAVELQTITNEEEICVSTRTTQGSCSHGTMLVVNFKDKVMKLAKGSAGTAVPSSFYKTVDISDVVNAIGEADNNHLFTIKLEKAEGPIRATIINDHTGKSIACLAGLETVPQEQESSSGLVRGKSPVGRMYDSPQLFVISGAPIIKKWYGKTWVSKPKVMFFGDSITQGTHNLPDDSFAVKCAKYFGDTITCGRGSGDIACCVNTVKSMVPILKPEAIVVTIGTNGGNTALYQKFIDICEYYNVILILNTCWACDGRSNVKTINNHIVSLGQLGCRLDLLTSNNNVISGGQNKIYFASDGTHLSPLGNELTYQAIINEFGWLKNNSFQPEYAIDKYKVYLVLDNGIVYNGAEIVEKGKPFSATLTLQSGCSLGAQGISVMMRHGELKNVISTSGLVTTINIDSVDGDIYIYADVNGGTSLDSGTTPEIELPTESKVLNESDFEVFDNTWILGSGTALGTGQDGYYTAYTPIKGYKTIDLTAQDNFATYYQFSIDEDLIDLTETRKTVAKGTSENGIAVPANALYLIVAHHRSNSTDANAQDGYALYFPKAIKANI